MYPTGDKRCGAFASRSSFYTHLLRYKLEDVAIHQGVLREEEVHEARPDCQLTLIRMRGVSDQGAQGGHG